MIYICMYAYMAGREYSGISEYRGYVLWDSLLHVLCKEIVLLGSSKMYWNYIGGIVLGPPAVSIVCI